MRHGGSRRTQTRSLAALATSALLPLLALAAEPASAAIAGTTLVDAGADIQELGGVAMAEDGSGGLVYEKRVDGRTHVFAARFVGGRWQPPQRVDAGQNFDSNWPRIGAGNGGRLVVTWTHEFGPESDRLFSASLDPGASRFQPPVPIDLNIGEATGTHPALAMNPGGIAYLVYRVVGSDAGLPPGYTNAETRLARFDGAWWSTLGSLVNRNQASPVANPTALNAPRVGVDVSGNGIVAFQEPDDEFVDRIWARRIFGTTLGIPLLVSPQQVAGVQLRGPADALSLDQAGFGAAAVVFRQQPGERSALAGTHVFASTIPPAFSQGADHFTPARTLDAAPGQAPAGAPGPPAVGVDPDGAFVATFGLGRTSLAVAGTDAGTQLPQRLDERSNEIEGEPVAELGEGGGSVVAWKVRTEGRAGIAVRESGRAATQLRYRSAPAGGTLHELLSSGSGLGDGLLAFRQERGGNSQIAAVTVDAPPLDFLAQTPIPWVRSRRVRITWDPAPNALAPVRYWVYAGRKRLTGNVGGHAARLRTARVGNGRHEIEILARDGQGQETRSAPATLKIDRRAPRVAVRRRGRTVIVRVSDGPRKRASGARGSATRIKFGDGGKGKGLRARHRYRRGGRFRLVVKTRDRARNRRVLKRAVRIR